MNPKAHWDAIKKLMGGLNGHHEESTIIKMTDKLTGRTTKNAKENAKKFVDHFENNVFNRMVESAHDNSVLEEIHQIPPKEHLKATPTSKEIQTAISKMANRKSPGQNGISPEAYKLWFNGEAAPYLENIIIQHWIDDSFDTETFHTVILNILKKGISQNPINGEASHCLIFT